MKKLFITLTLILGVVTARAQGVFKVGPVVAIPIGDAGDVSSFGLGADVYYMFGHEDSWVNFGPTVAFRNYFGKDYEFNENGVDVSIKGESVQFLPLAGAFRGKILGVVNWGSDIGYALGISDGVDNGFYFRPIVGIDIADSIEINASYEGISQDSKAWGAFTFGLLFEFGE